jgi:hypothetical protein
MRIRHDEAAKSLMIRIMVTVTALAIAAIHLVRPTSRIDGVLLGLLAVAVLPWLGSIFDSVEGPGWKVTYRRLQEELDSTRNELEATKGEVASTRQRAEFVESAGVSDLQPGSPKEEMRQLITRYDRIRETMKSGPLRTKEMTDVLRHLTVLADKLGDVDWSTYLLSQDGGERIAAYSYFYAQPSAGAAPEITYSLTNVENKPFGQYWAIRALGRTTETYPQAVQRLVPIWKDFLARLPVGTDRYYELSRIIDSLGLGQM